ncbi:barstar family protein [Brachybacterium sp. DNPG3]
MPDYRIDGTRIDTIGDLYDQFDREFMREEDWRMGASLDALDDVLYGLDARTSSGDPAVVVWHDHARSREALGVAATERWLLDKLDRPGTFDTTRFRADLDALRAGTGRTYFDIVLEVFADHPLVDLRLA